MYKNQIMEENIFLLGSIFIQKLFIMVFLIWFKMMEEGQL